MIDSDKIIVKPEHFSNVYTMKDGEIIHASIEFRKTLAQEANKVIAEAYDALLKKRDDLKAKLQVAVEALEMGAFHHSSCASNWYDNESMKPNWDGRGDHRMPKKCTCAHEKVEQALQKIKVEK